MNLSLYSGATGMQAQQLNLNVISNNIANVNTTGYKKNKIEFQDLLYQNPRQAGGQTGAGNVIPTGVEMGNGTKVVSTAKIFTQGQLTQTSEKMDVAIDGVGFFQVERPDDIYGSMMDLKEDLENSASGLEEIDGVSVTVAGLSYERYVYMLEITDSFQESLVVAIVLAFVIVLIVLRDVRLSLITILPVIAITLWLRGGMVLSDTPVNLVTVQISSLAIGLGVDYAIHMVQRVREARFENPSGSQEDWMEESLDETGNNVAMSAFTDFIGFMVLALSIMPLFVTFGLIMAVMILLSFVAAVIMLPALLYQFGNLESSSN